MSDTKQVLDSLFRAVRSAQTDLNWVKTAVYAASMKDLLTQQAEELDSIESEILTFSARRGWELSEFTSLSDSVSQAKLRISLLFGCTDSRIAELMICRSTNCTNRCMKHLNRSSSVDTYAHTLFQKYLDCQRSGIYQLLNYL